MLEKRSGVQSSDDHGSADAPLNGDGDLTIPSFLRRGHPDCFGVKAFDDEPCPADRRGGGERDGQGRASGPLGVALDLLDQQQPEATAEWSDSPGAEIQ